MGEKTNLTSSLFEENVNEESMNRITKMVIGSAYNVANRLGCGFLEKVYENSLAHEIGKQGLNVEQQKPIRVYYDDVSVGTFVPDLLVENCLIVELKTASRLGNVHTAQCLNYLKATRINLCLLINFGNPRVEIRRVAL